MIRNFESDNQRAWEAATWTDLASDSIGDVAEPPFSGVTVVQFSGEFAGARATMERSVDGTNWLPLPVAGGVPFRAVLPLIRELVAGAPFVRPRVIGGSPETAINVTLTVWR